MLCCARVVRMLCYANVLSSCCACCAGRSLTVTLAMVDSWCKAAKDKASMGPVRSIIKVGRCLLR